MSELVKCPKCGKMVPNNKFCEECGFPLTDEAKIEKSSRVTKEERNEARRIKKLNDEHKEKMDEQERKDKRLSSIIFLLILIFIFLIARGIIIGVVAAKKHHDNLPYLKVDGVELWKNPVTVKEYEYFLTETNYKSEAASKQNYIKHTNDGNMEIAYSVSFQEMNPSDPVVYVSFMDAVLYCNFKSNDEGLKEYYTIDKDGKVTINKKANGYRLPTEKQWTQAAKQFKELRKSTISEWCFDIYDNSENYRVLKKYQRGIAKPAEYSSFSDENFGVDTIGFRVVRK